MAEKTTQTLREESLLTSRAISSHMVNEFASLEGGVLSPLEGRVFGFICRNQDKNVTSTDLMAHFDSPKSTISETLSSLEERGYILFEVNPEDRRQKYLRLTEKGLARFEGVLVLFSQAEEKMTEGLSEEDIATYLRVCEQIRRNLGTKNG